MIESFVDLTYRGLALGRRVKLAQVRPTTGYLELPMPMPVGTTIAIVTDDGMTLDARVMAIQEQVAAVAPASGAAPTQSGPIPIVTGTARTPGMLIAPVLGDAAALAWWHARVGLPELELAAAAPPPAIASLARGRASAARMRTNTIPEPMRDPEEFTDVGPAPTAPTALAAAAIPTDDKKSQFASTQPMARIALPPQGPAMGDDETAIGPMPTPAPAAKRGRTRTPPRGSRTVPAGDDATVMGPVPSQPTAPMPVMIAAPERPSRRRAGFEDELAAAATVIGSAPVPASGEHSIPELIDDGKRTTVMDAVDPELLAALLADEAALGLGDGPPARPSSEGLELEDDTTGPTDDGVGEKKLKTTGGSVKRRRKKR